MADIFREVDEALNQERALQFWQENRNWIIGTAIAILVGTGIGAFYQNYRQTQLTQATDELVQLLSVGKISPEQLDKFSQSAPAAHATIAQMNEAGRLAGLGQGDDALVLYQQVIDNNRAPSVFRDMARLNVASIQLDKNNLDGIEKILLPVADKKNAFRFNAMELQGLLAVKQNNMAEANRLFTSLSDDKNAPDALRQRAQTFSRFYQP